MPVTLFDANYYRAVNPDLAGLNDAQLWAHFWAFGLNSGRAFSPWVDLNFYRLSNPDLAAAGLTANKQLFEHLQTYGLREVRQFSPAVNLGLYLALYPDLRQAFGTDREGALSHLQTFGSQENRRFAIAFDPNYYRQKYPDLQAAGLDSTQLLEHFLSYGINEGRQASEFFDIKAYLEYNPDLVAAGLNNQEALQHFAYYGIRENRLSIPGRSFSHLLPQFQLQTQSIHPGSQMQASDFAVDSSGNIYTGYTVQEPVAQGPALSHTCVAKYDNNGTQLLSQELQTATGQKSSDIEVDSAGNFYITGTAEGSLGAANAGGTDIFVSKYSSAGTWLWVQQIGSAGNDSSGGVAVNSLGNVCIAGSLLDDLGVGVDAFVAKYDSAGTKLWERKLGTAAEDSAGYIAADSAGNVYIAGKTRGDLAGTGAGGQDIFVAKYDSSGTLLWVRQLGTAGFDYLSGLDADSYGNVYITGRLQSSEYVSGQPVNRIGSPPGNAFVAKYDSNGTLLWQQQRQQGDSTDDLDADNSGNIYITGNTITSFPQDGNYGVSASFVAKYGSTGTEMWSQLVDSGYNIDIDSHGSVFLGFGNLAKFLPTENLL